MEEIIKDLEHTIKYFEDAQNDFQRGRVFQCIKILEALRIHDVVGQSEQLKMLEHIRHIKGLPLDIQVTIDKMYLSHL